MAFTSMRKGKGVAVVAAALLALASVVVAAMFGGVAESSTTIIHAVNPEIRSKLEACLRYPVHDEVVAVDGVKFYLYFPFRHGSGREAFLKYTPTGALISCLQLNASGIEPLDNAVSSVLKSYFHHLTHELGYDEVSVAFIPGLRTVYVAVPDDSRYDDVVRWVIGNVTGYDNTVSVVVRRVPYGERTGMNLGGMLYRESFDRLQDAGIPVVRGAFAVYNPLTGRVEVTIGISNPSDEDVSKVLRILAENPAVREAGELDVVFMEVSIGT